MRRLVSLMDRGLAWGCVVLTLALVGCVIWQVFSRYVLGKPSTVTDEMARFLFIWVGLLGAAYTLGHRRHLAMDFLLSSSKGRKRVVLWRLVDSISLFFAAVVMVYGGSRLVEKTLSVGQLSPALSLEMGWVYTAVPLSGVCMCLYLFHEFLLPVKDQQ
ncbi:MAG: TRAP transporter small permease [Pontibacterium sp.]